ncbi:DNA-binding protein [Irpex rosettiformis]|uniref:DNA-binding protein n=1 Tax=Irpex rosettiformis TaxID=378272 RepID=A0ACB8UJD3_9APHY|nr:DNA-binding protein [Irpex rosettiformis]
MGDSNEFPLTYNQTVKGITEFIEVAIHTILYVRQVYPAELFVRRKKYDTPVFQSRHPVLNEYISGAIKATRDELVLCNVDKLIVVIKSSSEDVAYERFIFSIKNMIEIEAYNKDKGQDCCFFPTHALVEVENPMSASRLGQYFRSFLVKLGMIDSQLGILDLRDDITFAIVLELKDAKAPSAAHGKHLRTRTDGNFLIEMKKPPPWVPAVPQHTTPSASDQTKLHMIRAIDTGVINISLAVQESEEKINRIKQLDAVDSKGKGRAY